MHGKLNDYTGQRFHYLTVTRLIQTANSKVRPALATLWECICDCGTITVVSAGKLKYGSIKSCGCMRSAAISKARTKHGGSNKRSYSSWRAMMRRCYSEECPYYHNYGGAGIKVCDRWHDYKSFADDMGEPPSDDHTIDRIDNRLGYQPGNCRWATRQEQARNRVRSVVASAYGLTMHLMEWAKLTGIPYNTLQFRVRKLGMPVCDAIRMKTRSVSKKLLPISEMPFADALRAAGAVLDGDVQTYRSSPGAAVSEDRSDAEYANDNKDLRDAA